MTLIARAPHGIDPHAFRAVLRNQANTVAVVTVPGPAGFTATTLTAISLNPQLISFAIAESASAWPFVDQTTHVAIHMLAADQEPVARTFATSGIDRFADIALWRPGPYGLPMLHNVLAVLICTVAGKVTAGDHTIVLCSPLSATHGPGEPLLYHRGSYKAF